MAQAVAQLIEKLLKEEGTKQKLAFRLGVSRQAINLWQEKEKISSLSKQKLAEILQVENSTLEAYIVGELSLEQLYDCRGETSAATVDDVLRTVQLFSVSDKLRIIEQLSASLLKESTTSSASEG